MGKDSENDMTNSPGGGDIFDVRKIRRLIELMNDHDLNEIDLRDGDIRVRLRKRGEQVVAESRPYVAAPAPVAAAPAAAAGGGGAAAPAADNYHVIKSPIVGTFYTSANPESPPFVKVGDHVGNDSIICIIEAMKVFNEIAAEVKGKVVSCLVENGSPVEYGQPLFKIDTKG
jgi:acetyl-CoA carboxylase biotin carboxyl carrier protein